MHEISRAAIDLIIREEVISPAYYEKHYRKPEWPGYSSGVTIGCGYDLGQATAAKIRADWSGLVPAAMLEAMVSCAGKVGSAGQAWLPRVRNQIDIPWPLAEKVFLKRDIPSWIAQAYHSLENCDLLSSTCLGVIVSLIYNRGTGGFYSTTDRNREMQAIKLAMKQKRFVDIPAQLDSMARLWPGSGVAGRRHREAALFRAGLQDPAAKSDAVTPPQPDPAVIANSRPDAPARTPQPKTTSTQNTSTVIVAAGPASAAKAAGWSNEAVALVLGFSICAAALVWFIWYRNRNPK